MARDRTMKAIINGLRYDTDKAILIGEGGHGQSRSDFNYWEAGLYKTPRSGRWFLAGEGHGMTRFASNVGNMRGWGSRIFPMDEDEAREWAEQHLTTAEVEAAGFTIEDA